MTKDQERKVLAQIKELIESTGKDSYIAAAFEGCVEDAEENINNDWCCSWKQRAETEAHIAEDADRAARAAVQKAANESLRADIAEEEAAKQKSRAEAAEAAQRKAEGRQQEYKAMLDDANNDFNEVFAEAEAEKYENAALKKQIIELKAKLYDYMTQG